MTKKLIIVSPHFPPTNAADHHRVRMALPYLEGLGWKVVVIAVDSRDIEAPEDPFFLESIPSSIDVVRVRVLAGRWTKLPGMGSLGCRCIPAVQTALELELSRVKKENIPTVVYFSSTQFPVHRIIPRIKSKWAVPVAMDFQDAWATEYYSKNPLTRPPGGRVKFGIANQLAFWDERRTVGHVDGFTTVSAGYQSELVNRYPHLRSKPFLVLPFGAAESDFELVKKLHIRQDQFAIKEGWTNWVYVGRGGKDMFKALRAFFTALKDALNRGTISDKILIHFIGTDYAAGARAKPSILPLAVETGVAPFVREQPKRIQFAEALKCLLDADALLVPGSDDSSYSASKIYPYLLTGKPMLTIFHENSSVVNVIKKCNGGECVTFASDDSFQELEGKIKRQWFQDRSWEEPVRLNQVAFNEYTAESMTKSLSAFLEQLLPAAATTAKVSS